MPREAKVILGDREYVIETLPIKRSRDWREKLAVPFAELTRAIETVPLLNNLESFSQVMDIAGMVRRFSSTLLGSMDTMLELLFDYSPALAADREWIEENAFDEEALTAFAEVLKLAYPLGRLISVVAGPSANRTTPNSRSANGASGTRPTVKSKAT